MALSTKQKKRQEPLLFFINLVFFFTSLFSSDASRRRGAAARQSRLSLTLSALSAARNADSRPTTWGFLLSIQRPIHARDDLVYQSGLQAPSPVFVFSYPLLESARSLSRFLSRLNPSLLTWRDLSFEARGARSNLISTTFLERADSILIIIICWYKRRRYREESG